MHSTTTTPNGTTEHASNRSRPDMPLEDPVINARDFVHTALDEMDRLVGVVLGMIDDPDAWPCECDATRVRKAAAKVRSNLLAASGELSSTVATETNAIDGYDWPDVDAKIVASVTDTIRAEAREHRASYIPASFWRRRIADLLATTRLAAARETVLRVCEEETA